MERPALQQLLGEMRSRRIDVIVVYKVDRLTRSLADFAKLVELFDAHGVSFVSVTQAFNTTTSMGRLTLNVLLSFAQFEREVTGERIRDKIAASKKKGIWMGGVVPLGYRVEARALHIVEDHAIVIGACSPAISSSAPSAPSSVGSMPPACMCRSASMERVDAAAASRSAGATSTRSYPTQSTSGSSRTRGRPMMASIPRSWSRRPGTAHRPSSRRTLIAARAGSLPPRIFSWDGSRMIVVMP